jgi:ferredoxin-NADP reductase
VRHIVHEQGGATTLELVADGHAGQPFAPGQFAWLKLPGVRSSLAEHPFSYSSSALSPDRPSFTIQPYAGFSKAVASFSPGSQILVDGPHGAFRLRTDAVGCVLIAGGIGITPSMSILRTAAEQHDARPFVVVYSVKNPDRIVFVDQLAALGTQLDLSVEYVASTAPPEWPGSRGRITTGILDASLPADLRGWQFLVCGPPPVVDASTDALGQLGIPSDHVHAERFVSV